MRGPTKNIRSVGKVLDSHFFEDVEVSKPPIYGIEQREIDYLLTRVAWRGGFNFCIVLAAHIAASFQKFKL